MNLEKLSSETVKLLSEEIYKSIQDNSMVNRVMNSKIDKFEKEEPFFVTKKYRLKYILLTKRI